MAPNRKWGALTSSCGAPRVGTQIIICPFIGKGLFFCPQTDRLPSTIIGWKRMHWLSLNTSLTVAPKLKWNPTSCQDIISSVEDKKNGILETVLSIQWVQVDGVKNNVQLDLIDSYVWTTFFKISPFSFHRRNIKSYKIIMTSMWHYHFYFFKLVGRKML